MKSKQTHSPRKKGLSRLERLLEASIRNELAVKALRKELCSLSLEFAQFKAATVPLAGTFSDSSEVWPWQPPIRYGCEV